MRQLESHELSCLLDCRQESRLRGDIRRDTLWVAGGFHSGYRTSTIKRLVNEGLLSHPIAEHKLHGNGLPDPCLVELTALGRQVLATQVPDHPLLHDAGTNRAKWRVIES